jgi:Outer membrane protein beta-barrel domain
MKTRFLYILAVVLMYQVPANAQNKFMMGFNAGGNVSRIFSGDTFPNNFSRRNRVGVNLGMQGCYNLKPFISIAFGANYVNKGYKLNNDTLTSNAFITQKTHSLSIPLGVIFRQRFSASSAIHEKFGISGNFTFRKDSFTTYNSDKTQRFRINDVALNRFYPMFYLGAGLGGNTESGDRYEFSIIYNQSFKTDANLTVQYGQGWLKSFPLSYRGGFLQFTFSYYFNMGNFKKSDEYFID